MRRVLIVLMAVAAGAFASAPARAEVPLTFTLGETSRAFPHRSFDLVSENDWMASVRVGAGWAFEMPGGALELDGAFTSGTVTASAHNASLNTSLWLRGIEVAATYRWALSRAFQPFARLGGSYDWATLTVDAVDQRVGRLAGVGMVGFSIPFVTTQRGAQNLWHPSFAFDVGLGYELRPDYDFDALKPSTTSAQDAIKVVPLKVGKMSLSGYTLRFALTVRV